MKTNFKTLLCSALIGSIGFTSCSKDNSNGNDTAEPYVLCLAVAGSGYDHTYYAVTTADLMSGEISPRNNGIEQTGYRDFEQGNQTLFSIGGLGVANVNLITRGSDGNLQTSGNFVFDKNLSLFEQADANTMLGMALPLTPADGDTFLFYKVDITTGAILSSVKRSMDPIKVPEWPTMSGMSISNGKVYMTYVPMNPTTYATPYTDTTYVAVYSYPELEFITVMKDTRTGPAGSFNAFNGILKVENGDMYVMSNSSLANGFSQSTKNAAFLRIPNENTSFDNYYFDFETKSGGLKPAHFKYIGNNLVLVEVSTINPQTLDNQWSDAKLKTCIVDLNAQTITDVTGIPVHDGNGARRFAAFVENGLVYVPITTSTGIFIYQVNPTTAQAVKGAEISASFAAGVFKIN